MPQTTDQMNFREAEVYISTGAGFTGMCGIMVAVAVSGGERMVGEEFTFCGDTPILVGGKRNPLDVTVRYVYTEQDDDPFELVRAQYETDGGGDLFIKWSPKGGDATEFEFETDENNSVLTGFTYPQGEARSPDITLCELTVRTASITKSEV